MQSPRNYKTSSKHWEEVRRHFGGGGDNARWEEVFGGGNRSARERGGERERETKGSNAWRWSTGVQEKERERERERERRRKKEAMLQIINSRTTHGRETIKCDTLNLSIYKPKMESVGERGKRERDAISSSLPFLCPLQPDTPNKNHETWILWCRWQHIESNQSSENSAAPVRTTNSKLRPPTLAVRPAITANISAYCLISSSHACS